MKRWTAAFLSLLQLFTSFGPGVSSALAQYNVRAQVQAPVGGIGVAPVPAGALAPLTAPSLSFKPTLASPSVLPSLPTVSAQAALPTASVQARAVPTAQAAALASPAALARPVSAAAVQTPERAAPALLKAAQASPAVEGARQAAADLPALPADMPADAAKGNAEASFAALLGQRLVKTSGDVSGPAVFAAGAEIQGRNSSPLSRLRERVGVRAGDELPSPRPLPQGRERGNSSLWSKPAVRWAAAGLGAVAAVAAIPLLIPHAGVVAAIGSAALTVIGIPQIVKNFRGGQATVKDVVLSGNLIWFAAATLLSVVSIGNGASLWWNLANVAGVVESAFVVGQINAYRRDKAELKATAAVVAGSAALVALIATQAFMPLKAWLDLSFTAA
ncbi:hypothetical protein EPO15_15300, partial [bacterium]